MDAARSPAEPHVGPQRQTHELRAKVRAGHQETIKHINGVLERHGGNAVKAAAELHLRPGTLRAWVKKFPVLAPVRDHRGAPRRKVGRQRMSAGTLVAVTEGDDQVHVEPVRLVRHRGAVASVRDELRGTFGGAQVVDGSRAVVVTGSTDGCAVRAAISRALDSVGIEHRWLVGARRSLAVPS